MLFVFIAWNLCPFSLCPVDGNKLTSYLMELNCSWGKIGVRSKSPLLLHSMANEGMIIIMLIYCNFFLLEISKKVSLLGLIFEKSDNFYLRIRMLV